MDSEKIAKLEKIKAKVGVQDLSQVTDDEFQKLQYLAAQGQISREQMKLLVEAIPHFVQLQQTYIDGLKSSINAAKETQKDALRGISVTLENITDLLKNIVNKSETEELRSKIADIALKLADYGIEIAKILQETNRENNNTWKYIAGGVSALSVMVLSVFMFNKNSK